MEVLVQEASIDPTDSRPSSKRYVKVVQDFSTPKWIFKRKSNTCIWERRERYGDSIVFIVLLSCAWVCMRQKSGTRGQQGKRIISFLLRGKRVTCVSKLVAENAWVM